MVQDPCSFSAQEISEQFHTDLKQGLNSRAVQEHRQKYGMNEIPKDRPKNQWLILADQFMDPIIYILTGAAILALLFSDYLEGLAIVFVILISVGIGFFMEMQAVRSLETLRKMGQAMTLVVRSGQKLKIKAAEVVPGDLLLLQTGDVVPADARLTEVDSLSVKESALTGESIPVTKNTDTLSGKHQVTDQQNMVFRGTMVVTGSGKAIVTATGGNTQLGIIQQIGMEAEKERTPLEKKLNQLSQWLIWLTVVFAILIVIAGYVRGRELLGMIETGVALAVAAIPEGLPIVATIALAQGMLRLSKRQVIIKKLEAVHTLGATNIICTDKTGTLTEDIIKVDTVVLADAYLSDVDKKRTEGINLLKENKAFAKMMLTGILCNNAAYSYDRSHSDTIEIALLEFARHMGYDLQNVRSENPEKLELPFDSDRKFMATVHQYNKTYTVYAKGAYEELASLSKWILEAGTIKRFERKEVWHQRVDNLASQGLRTLAFAYKETKTIPDKNNLTEELIFLGVMGLKDPTREDVKDTIATYKNAGIRVIMATGDHPETARKIAEEVGLLARNAPKNKVLEGKDLHNFQNSAEKENRYLLNASVFARVTPEQKLQLITFHQKNNHIVGMIGDGINDVPALKKADIGIAMGIRGTEAAREVADVILKNDKFTAIELAIRQGRVVFQNIRQFVIYLLSCNLAEILSVGIAALLNLPSPLLPLQILFLNLVTDVFPALALGLGKGEEDIMKQAPRNPREPIITRNDWYAITGYGLSISAAVIGTVVYAKYVLKLNWDLINNMAFYTLVLAQLFNVFNMPKREESFFNNEVTKNGWVWLAIVVSVLLTWSAYLVPPIAEALSFVPISPEQLGLSILFASASLMLAQFFKRVIAVIRLS